MHLGKTTLIATLSVAVVTGIAACGGSSSGSTAKPTKKPSSGSVHSVKISLTELSASNFNAMKVLKPLAAAGTGTDCSAIDPHACRVVRPDVQDAGSGAC